MSTPAPNGLPSAMAARLEAARAAETTPPAPPAPSSPPTPGSQGAVVTPPTPNAPPTPPTNDDRVTMTRAEFNEMQAAKGKVTAVEGRAEMMRMQLEESQHALTDLQARVKSDSTPPPVAAPPAPKAALVDTTGITFSPEEQEAYGESRAYVEKIVDLRIAERLNALLPGLQQQIEEAQNLARGTSTTLAEANARSFEQQMLAKVPNMASLFQHKHWPDFLLEKDRMTGYTYEQLITHNVQKQNVDGLANIYGHFAEKYAVTDPTTVAGYQGADPSANGTHLPPENQPAEKLKFSDRKRASEDFRKGRINTEQMKEVSDKFDIADKQGNVDYTT